MTKYLSAYSKEIKSQIKNIKSKEEAKEILANHRAKISFFQHERLIHLLVTLAFGLVFVMVTMVILIFQNLILIILDLIVVSLLVPYIFYYFSLENGVQNLYWLDQLIEKRC
jgi:hypothetical protein